MIFFKARYGFMLDSLDDRSSVIVAAYYSGCDPHSIHMHLFHSCFTSGSF